MEWGDGLTGAGTTELRGGSSDWMTNTGILSENREAWEHMEQRELSPSDRSNQWLFFFQSRVGGGILIYAHHDSAQ